MSVQQVLTTTGEVALQLLRLTAASADIFPPLKSVAGGALYIAEIAKQFHLNKERWQEFATYIQEATASVVHSLEQVDLSREDMKNNLEKLKGALEDVSQRVLSERQLPRPKRLSRFLRDPEMIAGMKKQVDDVIGLFQFGATVLTMIEVGKTFDAVKANSQTLERITRGVSSIEKNIALDRENSTLEKLQRIQNSTWDSDRVCLDDTRVELIDSILSWIHNANSAGSTIMLLTGVAGAGKTTIAHTIARRCNKNKELAGCFFFDRATAGRNTPDALFSTIAYELSRFDKRLGANIAAAIDEDRSLPLASISRHFEELILAPCLKSPLTRPAVIVIDALDEGCNETLFRILNNHTSRLPGNIRVFVTSRMAPTLGSLLRQPHVHPLELNIEDGANMSDMTKYVDHRLRELAAERNLGDDWPGVKLKDLFTRKAGGLFQWASTVCDYLRDLNDPAGELRKLVSEASLSTAKAEERMDRLYVTVLESFNWNDESFVESYERVMGIVVSSKVPVSVSAMRDLYQDQNLAPSYTLHRLSPLLTGTSPHNHANVPMRALHQSLHDFLIHRASLTQDCARFYIDKKTKSGALALLCLKIINSELSEDIPLVGYLSQAEEQSGVPMMQVGVVSEALWYACRFWLEHLGDADGRVDIQEALVDFIENKLVMWLEVVASSYGQLRGLNCLRTRMQEHLGEHSSKLFDEFDETYGKACERLGPRLDHDDRREESVVIAVERVASYRRLAMVSSADRIPNLAESLNNLSSCLSDMGQRSEALAAIQEAVEIRRRLAADRPAAYTPNLAGSLNNLSNRLSDMGQLSEALTAIQEAVKLFQSLNSCHPTIYEAKLQHALNDLSNISLAAPAKQRSPDL